MQYHEAANFLFDLRRFQVRPGTDSVADLLSELDDPGSGVRFVQVAGSNGKGSTARMVESILREAGLSVGLYTSPHLETLDERIRVDGRPITKRAVAEFVERVKPWLIDRAAAGEPLTFFEVVTAMGIWYFDREGVDVAVLEVGMGGEYDATSVVDPTASCVTTVSLEHTSVLGDTIEEIATTKAKVAPADRPLVTGATGEALDVIEEVAGDVLTVGDADAEPAADVTVSYGGPANHAESRVTIAGAERGATAGGDVIEARIPLLGSYQALNAGIATALARQTASAFDAIALDAAAISRGLRKAHWPGRFEVIARDPAIVLDGAHNPDAIATLAETLSAFDYEELHLVFAAMHDKDHRGMVRALPQAASVVTCRPNLDRAEDPEVLARVFENAGAENVRAGGSVADALREARSNAGEDDCVLVAGSLFAVGEARTTFTRRHVPKRIPDASTAESALGGADARESDVERGREEIVHRVLKTRLEERQAERLKAELIGLGGECVTSGVDAPSELHEVVLSGTLAQFRRLIRALEGQSFGLPGVAEELRRQLTPDAERRGYPWEDGTAVMGILNVTPDSFHDGGEYAAVDDAIARAKALVEAGADVIDVGGESTRPGADPVPEAEEIERVVPVIEAASELDATISIDTRKAAVAEAALDAGADVLNDVTGLEDPEMRFLAAEREAPVIVMHSIDAPVVPGREVDYDDVVEDVIRALNERVLLAEKAGIPRERVIVDPGLGFGKTIPENYELLGRIDEFRALGCPILVGHSQKSMFDAVGDSDDRLAATVAGTALAVERGADIVRVHDVEENRAAVDVIEAAADRSRIDGR